MPYSKKWISENPEKYILGRRARVMRYRKTDKGKFYALREVAKRDGRENTLTMEDFVGLLKIRVCFWCGGEVPDTRAGLDRLDNGQGYTLKNCVRCCWVCNVMKAQMSEREFISKCEKIIAVYRARSNHGAT